jgi:transposase
MDNCMQVPLHVPDVRVLSTPSTAPGPWRIGAESTLAGTRCRRCGREIRAWHGLEAVVRLRHLPWFGVPVCIELRPPRYRCPACAGHPPPPQRCDWYAPRRPNPTAYAP